MCKQFPTSNVSRKNLCITELLRKIYLYLQVLLNIQKSAEYSSQNCKYHLTATHLPIVFTTWLVSASYPAMCRFLVLDSLRTQNWCNWAAFHKSGHELCLSNRGRGNPKPPISAQATSICRA